MFGAARPKSARPEADLHQFEQRGHVAASSRGTPVRFRVEEFWTNNYGSLALRLATGCVAFII